LERFLELEGDEHARALLRQATAAVLAGEPPGRREFNFNTFDVTLDAEAGTVRLEDVLDTSEAGSLQLGLAEFLAALSR
jgi:hypothetical protein